MADQVNSCAITDDGAKVKCWGSQDNGRLGDGRSSGDNGPVDVMLFFGGGRLQAVGPIGHDRNFSCAVTLGGEIKCWGEDSNEDRLGNGPVIQHGPYPTTLLDTTAPSTPAVEAATSPAGDSTTPGTETSPAVTVNSVSKGDMVRIYSDSTCSTEVGAKRVEGGSVEVTVESLSSSGTYNFYAKAVDTAGNESSCSTSAASYVFDDGN